MQASIEGYDAGRTFDVVLLASHLVNTPNDARRDAMLRSVARHLHRGATAFVEWHPPEWFDQMRPGTYTGAIGAVQSTLRVWAIRHGLLEADVTYTVDEDEWKQHFTAQRLTIAALEKSLQRAGLTTIDDSPYRGDWVLLNRQG